MVNYKELIYLKDEKRFETPVHPFIVAGSKNEKFALTVLSNQSKREEIFKGIVTVFSDTPSVIHATVKAPDNSIIAKVDLDKDLPGHIPGEKGSGFLFGGKTEKEYEGRGLSSILRALLTKAFEANFKLTGNKKVIGDILKTNTGSLKSSFFTANPETGKLYYTTVTGEITDKDGKEYYVLTTYLDRESDFETQTALFNQYAVK